MVRPKSEDPTVPVMFRMKGSAWEWWIAEGTRRNEKPQKLIQLAVEKHAFKQMATGGEIKASPKEVTPIQKGRPQ